MSPSSLSGGDLNIVDAAGCRRYWEFFGAQAFEMHFDGFANRFFRFRNS